MAKIKALITLVIAKGKQVAPNAICDVSENEAKRLIALGFAEGLKKTTPQSQSNGDNNDGKSDENGGGQPVQPSGNTGNIQEPGHSDNPK